MEDRRRRRGGEKEEEEEEDVKGGGGCKIRTIEGVGKGEGGPRQAEQKYGGGWGGNRKVGGIYVKAEGRQVPVGGGVGGEEGE